jgi:hypothetical protein
MPDTEHLERLAEFIRSDLRGLVRRPEVRWGIPPPRSS